MGNGCVRSANWRVCYWQAISTAKPAHSQQRADSSLSAGPEAAHNYLEQPRTTPILLTPIWAAHKELRLKQ